LPSRGGANNDLHPANSIVSNFNIHPKSPPGAGNFDRDVPHNQGEKGWQPNIKKKESKQNGGGGSQQKNYNY